MTLRRFSTPRKGRCHPERRRRDGSKAGAPLRMTSVGPLEKKERKVDHGPVEYRNSTLTPRPLGTLLTSD